MQRPFHYPIEKLEIRLGYRFRDRTHLELALTHRSHSSSNYERLEFLGDAVLNFVIAAELFHRFDEASEGSLTRLRAALVKQPTLAAVARELDIGPFLNMSGSELKSGGYDRDSTLSDSLEAIVGAILLDAGFSEVQTTIYRWFENRLDSLSPDGSLLDAKSRLQEHLQALGELLPEYTLVSSRGKPPKERFEVECRTSKLAEPSTAIGPSRRKAEQAAAEKMLASLGVPP